MKKYYCICFLILSCAPRNTSDKAVETSEQTLTIAKIKYGDSSITTNMFYDGFEIIQDKQIDQHSFLKLEEILKDSTNYLKNKSKNCPSVPEYGFKLRTSNAVSLIFISKEPCLKITILNNENKNEIIRDLTENNNIIPFLDSLFTE